MIKYKNFGELTKGDYVFSSIIDNSAIKQNCKGDIYNRYIINNKYMCNGMLTLRLVVDKSTFINGWKHNPEDHNGEFSIDVQMDETIHIINLRCADENKFSKTFYSTNIDDIQKNIEQVIEIIEKRTEELETTWRRSKNILSNMKLNFSMRKDINASIYKENNKKEEHKEIVTLDAVYV